MRSPKKVQTTLGLVGAGLVLSLASEVMMPGGGFWSEMATTFEEGASEGTTGQDRLVVWGAAAKVWTQHPIVGVGLANFGPYASGYFQYGELEGMYADPRTIFLKAVHNDPVQLLAETGLLGLGLYCAMLVLFFQKANRLRRPAFRRAWQNETGGLFKLEHVSFGFEGAMVALLLNGLFYPQLDRIWFWGLLVFMWIIYHHLEGVVRRERQLQQRVAYGGG
jgi:O-antigen ligase